MGDERLLPKPPASNGQPERPPTCTERGALGAGRTRSAERLQQMARGTATSRPQSREKKPYCLGRKHQEEGGQTNPDDVTLGTEHGQGLGQKKKKRCSPATYLAMLGLPVSAIGVGQVAVLVPPATVMRQGTVAEGDIVVSVESRKLPPVVVSQSVPCRREDNRGEDKSHPGVGLVPWPERGLSRTVPRLENAKDPAGDVTGSPSSPQTAKTRTGTHESLFAALPSDLQARFPGRRDLSLSDLCASCFPTVFVIRL